MHEDLARNYRRWRAADEQGDDSEADAAFAAVFDACVPVPLPAAQCTATTMAAVHAASAADARRAALTRRVLLWSGLPAAGLALYFGAGPVFSTLSSGLVGLLNLLVALVVWFANGHDVGSGVWASLTAMGRAAAAFAADPKITIAMLVFQAVAIAALAALHRLLGPEREWLK